MSSPPSCSHFPEARGKAPVKGYNSRRHLTKSTSSERQAFGELLTPGHSSGTAACTQGAARRFNEASSTGEVSIRQCAPASGTTPEAASDTEKLASRGTDSGSREGDPKDQEGVGKKGRMGVPHDTDLGILTPRPPFPSQIFLQPPIMQIK